MLNPSRPSGPTLTDILTTPIPFAASSISCDTDVGVLDGIALYLTEPYQLLADLLVVVGGVQ